MRHLFHGAPAGWATLAAVLAAWSASSLIGFVGCAGRKPPPSVAAEPYDGPPATLDSAGPAHVVVFDAPSPGWTPGLDQVREDWRHMAVYITLRSPDPTFLYPTAVARLQVGTGVTSATPVRVFVRVLDFNTRSNDASPYRLAVTKAAVAANP